MKPADLLFTARTAAFGGQILALSAERPVGAEIYTYQTVSPANDFGQLWAGLDEAGRLAAALLTAGGQGVLLTETGGLAGAIPDGSKGGSVGFPAAIFPSAPFSVLANPAPARSFPADVCRVESGARVREMFALLHGTQPRESAEARYVYCLRAANAGLANAFGVTHAATGALCAVARISAKNRKYALIGDVFTKKEYRGNGFASRLLAACEAQAAAEGLIPVLYCLPTTARFYRARGYRSIRPDEL